MSLAGPLLQSPFSQAVEPLGLNRGDGVWARGLVNVPPGFSQCPDRLQDAVAFPLGEDLTGRRPGGRQARPPQCAQVAQRCDDRDSVERNRVPRLKHVASLR